MVVPKMNETPAGPAVSRAESARVAVGGMFFLLGVGYASWAARIPALRARIGLDDRGLGLLLLTVAVGAILSFRAAPPLIARHGSRRLTRLSSVVACAAFATPG